MIIIIIIIITIHMKMDRKPKNIMLKAYDFSDVLLLKRRFYLTCVIIRDLAIAANLEFGALRLLSEQSSSSSSSVLELTYSI